MKGWRWLLPPLSQAGQGSRGEAHLKAGVCPGPRSVPAGCRGRMSLLKSGLIHRPVASQRVWLSDLEPRRTYTGSYSLLWDVNPNGKQQGAVRICHKYLLAKTSISPTVVRSPSLPEVSGLDSGSCCSTGRTQASSQCHPSGPGPCLPHSRCLCGCQTSPRPAEPPGDNTVTCCAAWLVCGYGNSSAFFKAGLNCGVLPTEGDCC